MSSLGGEIPARVALIFAVAGAAACGVGRRERSEARAAETEAAPDAAAPRATVSEPPPESAGAERAVDPLFSPTPEEPLFPCGPIGAAPPFGFDPRGRCGPPPPEPGPRGSLRDSAVAEAVRTASPLFRACNLHGTAVVRVFVEADGHVRSASVYRDRLSGTSSAACLLHAVESVRFPAPGEPAEVIVPFAFRGEARDAG